ncbi:uncharacterized protein LOC105665528 [Ceratitis capitata]|uniref:(Mediterranean fruit fly) hypothetical protein n=1 Tax=Ceratitis capitata TaxID=7213 RepID=A0A811VB81_CERCA|nr:uncharacterized protein LOC105665528 [Ceratitis capitata]CAD7012264.1 unnamed protein product [Ceratitis capitata]
MLRFIAYLFAILLVLSAAHAALTIGYSDNFQRTQNFAAPPPDLSLPPIRLPEFTPISEEPQE